MIATDRIEKELFMRAPRSRVWKAITTVDDFNAWFGVALRGTFSPGEKLSGKITMEGYDHLTMDIKIESMEPERFVAWRWGASNGEGEPLPGFEEALLVTFELDEVEGGTRVRLVESGYDAVPPELRGPAYRGNDEGWTEQLQNIRKYVEEAA